MVWNRVKMGDSFTLGKTLWGLASAQATHLGTRKESLKGLKLQAALDDKLLENMLRGG